ncbi:hypothetical protein BB561_005785 [Smittium simulii]|uniref:Glycine cleavage system H protein n=1 Tax=Smittium simulii TaxID=133385 RepID=A0A2T9Y8B5_9FUNG|nr:hypothetical protein BB561_005785 [Smittium simulii]
MALNIFKTSFAKSFRFQPVFSRFYSVKKFSASHEWITVDNGVGTIGITDHAQKSLGDVVYVEIPEVGDQIELEGNVGAVESVKAASDLYSPVSGEILEANSKLIDKPKLINQSPEGEGWIFKIKLEDEAQLDNLMTSEEYAKLVGEDH